MWRTRNLKLVKYEGLDYLGWGFKATAAGGRRRLEWSDDEDWNRNRPVLLEMEKRHRLFGGETTLADLMVRRRVATVRRWQLNLDATGKRLLVRIRATFGGGGRGWSGSIPSTWRFLMVARLIWLWFRSGGTPGSEILLKWWWWRTQGRDVDEGGGFFCLVVKGWWWNTRAGSVNDERRG